MLPAHAPINITAIKIDFEKTGHKSKSAVDIPVVETTDATQNMTDNELRLFKIEQYLQKNQYITNAIVQQMFSVSTATANRILAKAVDDGCLQKVRIGKYWGYVLIEQS